MIERVQPPSHPISALASPLGGEGTLKRRVAAIVDRPDWRVGKCGVAIVAVAAISLFCSVRSSADTPPPASAAAPVEAPTDTPQKTVRVVNELGEPVTGATVAPWAIRSVEGVSMLWAPNGFGESNPPTLTTDADGKATIPIPQFAQRADRILPRELACRVEHPDYAQTVQSDVCVTPEELEKVATIVLQHGARIEVTALRGGQPLPVDRVRAQWSGPAEGGATVNTQGHLELPRLAGMQLVRLAYLPEQGPMLISDVEVLKLANGERRELAVEVKPAVRVEGRLDPSLPRPVRNGRILAKIIETADSDFDWRANAWIHADGTFAPRRATPRRASSNRPVRWIHGEGRHSTRVCEAALRLR